MKKLLPLFFLLVSCVPQTATVSSPIEGKNGVKKGTMNITFKNSGGSNAAITAIASDGEFFNGNLIDSKNATYSSGGSSGEEDYVGKTTSTRSHYTTRSGVSTKYSSHASAVLIGNRGHSMKCNFTLSNPASGVTAGAIGECKISDGREVPVSLTRK